MPNISVKRYFESAVLMRSRRIKSRIGNKKNVSPISVFQREKIEESLNNLFSKAYTVVDDLKCEGYITKEPVGFSDRECGTKAAITKNAKVVRYRLEL